MTKDGETVHNITYEYDDLNRLYRVRQDGNLWATYEYDANGNRIYEGEITRYQAAETYGISDQTIFVSNFC